MGALISGLVQGIGTGAKAADQKKRQDAMYDALRGIFKPQTAQGQTPAATPVDYEYTGPLPVGAGPGSYGAGEPSMLGSIPGAPWPPSAPMIQNVGQMPIRGQRPDIGMEMAQRWGVSPLTAEIVRKRYGQLWPYGG